MNFKVTNTKKIFEGVVFDITCDDIEYDSGNKGIREVVIHNGGSVVVAQKDDGKIILVKQFRYPFKEFMYELPAGKLEKNEDPLLCAERELTEETGFRAGKISKLGAICTTPGFCTEVLHIYLAEELVPGAHDREEGEYGMETYEFTLAEIQKMISSGEITDAKTICGINYLQNLNRS
ncbi:MAG: NUDIX hydrolase [Rhodothermaceae bacterium]